MSKNYFSSFPVVNYGNVTVRDVTRRAAVSVSLGSDPRSQLPLELRPGTRADVVASRYYGDASATWLVYVATGVIDPSWGWYLDDEKLGLLATNRFGSREEAQRLTRRYVTNWPAAGEQRITTAGWAAMTDEQRAYWSPNFGAGGVVLSYGRRRDDWYVTTNRVIDVATATSVNGSFTTDERAQFTQGGAVLGNCQVSWSNSTHVYARHVAGNTTTSGSVLTGANSGATMTVSNTTVLLQNIPPAVESYWEPESEWDYMINENESRREVRVVDSRYLDQAWRELGTLLK